MAPLPATWDEQLRLADLDVARARAAMTAAVQRARSEGVSWDRLGVLLGVTGEALRRRHAADQPPAARPVAPRAAKRAR